MMQIRCRSLLTSASVVGCETPWKAVVVCFETSWVNQWVDSDDLELSKRDVRTFGDDTAGGSQAQMMCRARRQGHRWGGQPFRG